VAEDVISLLEDYLARFERGERPDLRLYLERAGGESDELARLVDVWLQAAPAPEPSREQLEETRAWLSGEPPILSRRTARGLTRDAVVDLLVERFHLPSAKREKTRRYYHQVETGQLPPSPRVREALAAILGGPVRAWKPRPLAAQPAYFRAEEAVQAAPAAAPADEAWDEVDELFRGE
jgi:transcriptional regulator with XRE-family HTH domain